MGRNRDRWMPHNWGDYLRDTRHLSTEQHGAYLLLIGHYWTTGSLPDSDQQLARICGLEIRRWRAHRPTIYALFRHPPEAPNPWWHKRIEHEIVVAQDASQRAKAKAEARWKKDAPAYAAALPQDAHGICCDDAATMQRPQDHKTTSSSPKTEKKGADAPDFPETLRTDAFAKAWKSWEDYRTEAKLGKWKPVTVKAKLAELAGMGHDAACEAIRASIANGWHGIFEPKANGQNGHGKNGNRSGAIFGKGADEATLKTYAELPWDNVPGTEHDA